MMLIIAAVTGCISMHLVTVLLRLTNDSDYYESFAIRHGYRPMGNAGLDMANMVDITVDAQFKCLLIAPIMGMASLGCLISVVFG